MNPFDATPGLGHPRRDQRSCLAQHRLGDVDADVSPTVERRDEVHREPARTASEIDDGRARRQADVLHDAQRDAPHRVEVPVAHRVGRAQPLRV